MKTELAALLDVPLEAKRLTQDVRELKKQLQSGSKVATDLAATRSAGSGR